MNKEKNIVLGLTAVFAVILIALIVNWLNPVPVLMGSRADAPTNMMSELTHYTTSTSTALPVKVLDRDPNRRYAVISNVSTTPIYLYFTSDTWTLDGSGTPATSTITALNGVSVVAGERYEINPDNMIYGHIWASSTVAGVAINISYK